MSIFTNVQTIEFSDSVNMAYAALAATEMDHKTVALTAAPATTAVNYTLDRSNITATTVSSDAEWRNASSLLMKDDTRAIITAIRANVTSTLKMFFQNTTPQAPTNEFDSTPTISTVPAASVSASVPNMLASNATRNYFDEHQITANATTTAQADIVNASTAASTLTQLSMATMEAASSNPAIIDGTANVSTAAAAAATATAFNNTMGTSGDGESMPSITFLSYPISVRSNDSCSKLFADFIYPVKGKFCDWTWDGYLCWPTTPAGALARMHCPTGIISVDPKHFANRKCELNGHWGARPNTTQNTHGWTNYQPCIKPELKELFGTVNEHIYEIAIRTRTLEIVGLVLSLFALIVSLTIFCKFRSLRNNRTKIHKNLFIAMILQVIVRLIIYLDQAIRRHNSTATEVTSAHDIGYTPILFETSYTLLEYAKTAMFMWMWIEGFYLHNMVATLAVFHGGFPHTMFSLIGWFFPFVITLIWAICTAMYLESWLYYTLSPYYWIMEGPRCLVILLNFFFLINIIRVLIVKLRESQASDVEQTRKAVKAAIVLLPLLGITNLLHFVPISKTPWKFALWSYITHFLTSFQGFFIALIYCFLNGEVRAVILKNIAVYMSVRGHHEWVPRQGSYSGAYNTAPDTEPPPGQQDPKRNGDGDNTPAPKHRRSSSIHHNTIKCSGRRKSKMNNNNNYRADTRNNCLLTLCFRGQKVLRPPANSDVVPPETNV